MIDEDADSARYHIRPEDINTNCKQFLSAFGKAEVEIAAQYVVRFCQKLGGWKAFSGEDLEMSYLENGGGEELVFNHRKRFPFQWLNKRLLARRADGKYCVTDFFIDCCFRSSPVEKAP